MNERFNGIRFLQEVGEQAKNIAVEVPTYARQLKDSLMDRNSPARVYVSFAIGIPSAAYFYGESIGDHLLAFEKFGIAIAVSLAVSIFVAAIATRNITHIWKNPDEIKRE